MLSLFLGGEYLVGISHDTDQRILEQAMNMIRENGEDQLSLRKLARAIGLTTGAFYKHFATKDALLRAVTQLLSQREEAKMAQVLGQITDPEEKLLVMAAEILERFEADPHLMHFLFFNPAARDVLKVGPGQFGFYDQVIQLIKDVLRKRGITIAPQILFIQLWSFIQGYGLLIDSGITSYDPNLVRKTLKDLLEVSND